MIRIHRSVADFHSLLAPFKARVMFSKREKQATRVKKVTNPNFQTQFHKDSLYVPEIFDNPVGITTVG